MIQRFRVTAGWLGVTGLGLNIGNPRLTTVEGRIEITGVPFVLPRKIEVRFYSKLLWVETVS